MEPTAAAAVIDQAPKLDFIQLIQQGALSTYPLLLCSIIVLGIVLERVWSLRGIISSTARLTANVVPVLARGDVKSAVETVRKHRACPARRVYEDLIEDEHGVPMPELERVATERTFEEVQGAGSNLWVLGTIGSAAPFIGLFGTVLGIIRAFHAIALAGTGGFGVVASGISEALIATALGLGVGIIAVVFYNYFQARVDRIDAALRIGSGRVLEAVAAARRGNGVQ
jgi:biopolymer transport protein ExbB